MPTFCNSWHISFALKFPLPVPKRIFAVTGIFTLSTTSLHIEIKLSGSPIKAAPAHILVIFGAGHPKFKSIISALSSNNSAASAISADTPPKICGMNGFSSSQVSIFLHDIAASRVNAVEFVNSVIVKSAPHSLANNL